MDFREAVRVIWPGEVSGVVARAVNLSPAGILVDAPTPTPCPVGSDVLCDVTLPRGPRLLRGRVAHRRVLPSAKIGMGIEFVDLSPREAAELRDVVDESEERPQRVKVRFEGTNQIVRARATATPDGFQLVTALPFLKLGTAVDMLLAPDAQGGARGRVVSVSLDGAHADGAPRLLIDVRVVARDAWDVATPVVEPLAEAPAESVPERIWEPEDLGATAEAASMSVPVDLEQDVPTLVTSREALAAMLEGPGAAPALESADQTELVSLAPRPGRWRALGLGTLVGAIGLVVFVLVGVALRTAPTRTSSPPSIALPAIGFQAPPPVAGSTPPVAAAPVAAPPVEDRGALAAPRPTPVAAPAAADFTVGLAGTLAGAHRYVLRAPDGVAFNLPHARATMKVGTYHPDVPGLRIVWVRGLPGGGTHLRFFFGGAAPAPLVELHADGVRVIAR